MKYDFQAIEAKWQARWADEKTFRAPNPGDPGFNPAKPKYYVLDMFPYPSGVGLHVGHPLGFIATDITGRYKRMRGFNVLHTMGFDAFGLPAEQYAVEHNVHPRVTTENNIENMVRQLKQLGFGYDWDRTLATTDPGFVKWTQWIFLQLFHSYYDPVLNRAMPIDHLIKKLEGEDYLLTPDARLRWTGDAENIEALAGTPIGLRKWHELEPDQQARLLDEYRLAYLADVEVNWCPRLGTVLANEEVTNEGRSERGNHPVVKRALKQWMLRITAYADRLADDLNHVKWPESVKLLQRNWIGRSTGARVDFPIPDSDTSIRVFTTRPDTLFGATYMVLAPEHPLVEELTTPDHRSAVDAYRKEAAARSSIDRGNDSKTKTGVFTGVYATNPVTGDPVPVWVADYVMMGYGTGAIMAVPAHDTRDHAFAKAFGLPIVEVVQSPDDHDIQNDAFTGSGLLVNSVNDDITLNGLEVEQAKPAITAWLADRGLGEATTNYRLRDWLFSRQRYWGEPFPILHGPRGEIRGVPEISLPVELPPMDDFRPSGSDGLDLDPDAPPAPPLGRAGDDWKKVTLDGVEYTRELNTMPNWAGSCWYYLRYLDPDNNQRLVGKEAEQYWMTSPKADGTPHAGGVDLYVGGVEHAVLHLLYARFWHKVLFDLGHVSTPEPFGRLFSQGYIQAYCYRDERGIAVTASEVVNQDGKPASAVQGTKNQTYTHNGQPVTEEFGKMGKSLKNAVGPDDICTQYGADTLRLYEMYLGPLDQSKVWNTNDIVGVHRFLNRLWRNLVDEETGASRITRDNPSDELRRATHATIKRVTDAMDGMHFNVAIAALIELNNKLVALDHTPEWVAETLIRLLSPLAPHLAEELWELTGHVLPNDSVAHAEWPEHDPGQLVSDTVDYPVQVNGKMRGKVTVPADADDDAVVAAAKQDPNVAEHVAGKTVRKAIVVKGRMVNLVVG